MESHVSSLLRKLGVTDRRQLARRQLPAQPIADAGLALPPALELLADAATFVGRAAERDRAPRAVGARRARDTRCWSSSPARPGSARAGSCRSWPSRSTPAAATCCSGRATRTSTSRTVRSLQAIVDDAARSTTPSARRREAAERWPAVAGAGPAARTPAAESRRADVAGGGARRHPQWLAAPRSARCCSSSRTSTGRRRRRGTSCATSSARAGRAPLLVVATARDTKPDLDADLATLLADLERSPRPSRGVAAARARPRRGRRSSSAPAEQTRPT